MKAFMILISAMAIGVWMDRSVLLAGSMEMGSMEHMKHSGKENYNLSAAKLGTYKKSEFWSKKKLFLLKAPLVPVTPGVARFEVSVYGPENQLLKEAEITKAAYEMIGMKMDDSDVSVEKVKPGVFQLVFPVSMPGFWKVVMEIKEDGHQDTGYIKFVTR